MTKWLLTLLCFFQTLSSYEISIVTIFRNEAPYLDEWVKYHHLIGVDHFYLYNNNSTDNYLEILQPYIDRGIVEIIDWPTILDYGLIAMQMMAFKDALKRIAGATEWAGFIDIDEFVVPMKNRTIKECFKDHFSQYDGIFINWRNFGTNHVTIPQGNPIINKLTASSFPYHSDNAVGKSFIKPDKVDLACVWYPHHFVMQKGSQYANSDGNPIYFTGWDLKTDGFHHNKHIVIHHYCLRDEWFFHNRRLTRAKQLGNDNVSLLMEHYESFNLLPNFTIVNFLKKFHPNSYKEFWGGFE